VPIRQFTRKVFLAVVLTGMVAFGATRTDTGCQRVGALCNDGTSSSATGRGTCSHHGGVNCWKYSDGTCTKP
jgi:hypothetical protein